jgi:truncated hemoglobin YjbI
MRKFLVMSLISAIAFSATACGDDDDDKKTPAKMDMSVDMTTEPDMTADMPVVETTLYERLGKRDNIKVVITAFVGRVVADDKINGYFLKDSVDAAKLIDCLTDQVSEIAGGPEKYMCRDMKSSHAGLGISAQDYSDLAGHLVAELTARGVAQADIDAIAAVLTAPALVADIVEAPNNNESIYHRLGRKPGIAAAIDGFVGRVLMDDKINGYFLNNTLDAVNLKYCLTEQVGALTGGPNQYPNAKCRDMKTSHAGLGISTNDYNDLAGHLVAELTAGGVAEADISTIAGALTAPAFVADIVEDADNNKTIYQRLGRKANIGMVLQNFAGRVLADPSLKDYFAATKLTDGKPDRLFLCLTSQVCDVTGGPCEYGKEALLGANVCKSMAASHAGMTDTAGNVVTINEFNALVGHLVAELTDQGVAMDDIGAIGAALGPTCKDIVSGGTGCPN